jgi:hypothetical protein
MKTHRILTSLIAVLLLSGLSACHSISNPFMHMKPDYQKVPKEALHALALEIEKSVQEGNRTPKLEDRDGVVVNTPEVIQAIRMRAIRHELIDKLMANGHAYLQPNGQLYILRNKDYHKSTKRHQRDLDAQMIMNEATDRWTIYEGIVKASKFSARALSAVEDAFYDAQVETLPAGQKYEDRNKKIQTKAQ